MENKENAGAHIAKNLAMTLSTVKNGPFQKDLVLFFSIETLEGDKAEFAFPSAAIDQIAGMMIDIKDAADRLKKDPSKN